MKTKLAWVSLLSVLELHAFPAFPATYYWDDGAVTVNSASGGGSGAWTVGAAGWEDGTLAQNWTDGNAAVFGGTAGTVTLGGPISASGLTFSAAGYVVTNNTLTVGATGLSAAGDLTLASAIVLGSAQAWANTTGTVNLNGTLNNGGNTLTLSGAGNFRINTSVSGTGGITKSSTGTLYAQGTHTFSGTTAISTGYLEVSQGPLSMANSVLNVTSTDTRGVDIWSGKMTVRGLTGTGNIASNGSYANGLTWWWTTSTDKVGLSINVPTGESYTWTGILKDYSWQVNAKLAVEKTGPGTQSFNSANTFSGALYVNGGTLQAGYNSSLVTGSSLGLKSSTRTVTVNTGATLRFTLNNIFGGSGLVASGLPTVAVNGGTFSTTRFNVIGNLTLNGGALVNSNATDPGTYDGFQFIGTVTVGGASASTISTTTAKGNHLLGGGTTTFNVADATGDPASDLIVSTILRDGSGDYAGTGALTKTGAGTMELAAANTYTGATTVNGGTLLLSAGALASAVTVNSTGTFAVSGGALTTTTTVNSGGQLQIRTGGGVGGAVNVASGGALVISGSGALNNNATIASGGTLDVSGATGGVYSLVASSTFSLGHTGAAFTDVVTGGTLATGAGTLRVGVGAGTVATLTSAGGLRLNGGRAEFDLSNDPVAGANDRIELAGTLDLSAATTLAVNPTSSILGNGSYPLVTYAALSGTVANLNLTGVVSGGRQSFALSTTTVPNTLTLDVTGVAAHLVWNNAAATGVWDTQTANANWDHGGANDYFVTGDIVELADTANATETLTIPGDVSPSSIQATHTAATAFSLAGAGRITGTTGLTVDGGGTLTLANTGGNDFSGATQVSNGSTLNAGVANALSPASALTVTNGTVNVAVAGVAAGAVALQADGAIGGAGSLNASGITATGGAISAGLGGTGALSVPSGTVHLTGAAAHSGGTTVSAGAALTVDSGGSLGAVTVGGTLTLNTATLTGTATVQTGGALQIAGAATLGAVANAGTATISGAGAVTLGGLLSGGGAWVKNGAGTTTVTGGLLHTQVNSSSLTINEGTLDIRDAVMYSGGYRTPLLTVGNGAGSTARLVVNNTLYNESGAASPLQNNLGGLTFNHDRFLLNGGTVVYAGTDANYVTDSRSFTIQAGGGTIEVEHAGTTVTFQLSAGSTWDDFMLGASTLTFAGPGNVILNNVIHDGNGGTSAGGLAKTGSGTLTLGGANNFSGPVAIQDGLVKMTNAAGLGTVAGATTVSAGAALDLNGTTLNAEPVTLNGTGVSAGGALINGSATEVVFSGAVTLASDAAIGGTGNYALSGAIGGTGGLTKVGANAIALTNASNTYGGATVVSNGVLAVTGNLPAGAVSVAAGATLAGTGTVGGSTTVNGTLSPGTTAPGTLTFAQDLVLNPTAALAWKWADPNMDAVVVQGALTLDGTLTVTDLTTVPEGTYTLITYSGALTDNGLALTDPGDGRTYTLDTATAGQVKLVVSTVLTPYAQWWKDIYGIEPAPPEGGDYDDDGTPNGDEFAAQTNPTDNTSYLHLTNVAPAGNDITISIFTGAATYDLERTDDLLGTWTDIGDIVGDDTVQDVTDTGAASGTTWFYRVKVQ